MQILKFPINTKCNYKKKCPNKINKCLVKYVNENLKKEKLMKIIKNNKSVFFKPLENIMMQMNKKLKNSSKFINLKTKLNENKNKKNYNNLIFFLIKFNNKFI